MVGQGLYLDLHIGEQRQAAEQAVQFVIALDVEDADVGVFAHHAPDMAPLAFALQLLRVFLLVLLDLRNQGGVQRVGDLDNHFDHEQHGFS